MTVLQIKACGHGSRQMCQTDKYGFPKVHKTRSKTFAGWKTGDVAFALQSKGKVKQGEVARVTIRQRNSFLLNGRDIHPKYLRRLHQADGYGYTY